MNSSAVSTRLRGRASTPEKYLLTIAQSIYHYFYMREGKKQSSIFLVLADLDSLFGATAGCATPGVSSTGLSLGRSLQKQDSQCVFDESVQVELGRDETGSHDLRKRTGWR